MAKRRSTTAKKWWFIVFEEMAPTRQTPLVAETITQKDPVAFLADYEHLLEDTDKTITLRAFWLMDRPPTKAELGEWGG